MERLSLRKESDPASVERLHKLEKELADLKEEQSQFNAQWQAEKEVIEKIRAVKETIDQVNLEIQQAERDYDLNKMAELRYGKLTELQRQLETAETQLTATQTTGKTLVRL